MIVTTISCGAALSLLAASFIGHDCWELQTSGVSVSLRGVSAVDRQICWASGAQGTVLRTVDGGATWHTVSPVGYADCDFRDIQAFGAEEAVIMSSGEMDCILRTENAGASWKLVYQHHDPEAFFNGMAFWDEWRGLLMGDPLHGRLFILITGDGGRSWSEIPTDAAPKVAAGEAGFAASGTNLCTWEDGLVWIGLGGAEPKQHFTHSHVWKSADYGATWEAFQVPLSRSSSQGIFSIAASSKNELIAVGGDYARPELALANVAFSRDGGKTWWVPKQSVPNGYRSAVAVVPHTIPTQWLATGPTGTDASQDQGNSWQIVSSHGFHALSFAADGAGWAVGSEGRIAKFRRH